MKILEIKDLSYCYQDGDMHRYILHDINITFEKGKFYTILGKSGSGKTTLLSLLGGLEEVQDGRILYASQDISNIGYESYRRNKVSTVFQSYNLIQYMNAHQNVRVAMNITDNKLPDEHSHIAYNLLDYLGITREKANRKVSELSGGEQQRVAIARALSTNVDVVLADEPTGNLNSEIAHEIVDIFKELAHEHQKCVIIVTHDNTIASMADEVLYLQKGKIL